MKPYPVIYFIFILNKLLYKYPVLNQPVFQRKVINQMVFIYPYCYEDSVIKGAMSSSPQGVETWGPLTHQS